MQKRGIFLTSVFIYTIMACVVFWIVYSRKIKHGLSGYSFAELIPFWLLIRLCPLMMLEKKTQGNIISLAADTVLLILICVITAKSGKKWREAAVVYMFSPLPVTCIAVGTLKAGIINASAVVAAAVFLVWLFKKHSQVAPSVLMPGYITLCTGSYIIMYSLFCKFQNFSDFKRTDVFPVTLTAGLICVVSGAVILILSLYSAVKKGNPAVSAEPVAFSGEPAEKEKFGIKNIIHMVVLTALYAVVVFFQIGSHEAPETGKCFTPGENEIIIDLGDYVSVSKLDFFLGHQSSKNISVSTYNETEKQWIFISEENLPTAYAWNTIDVNWTLRYIGLVLPDYETYINEIVILNGDNEVLTPVNIHENPELFDEQDMYPEYPTYFYRMMFDEIYHGRTGYEFLHNLSIYETTHPPLGKTFISIGIALFGMNPFGWRFIVAVFGTAMVPMMYIFAWKISRRSDIAFTGGMLIATEFMHFTLSRIATIDIIVAQFILMMFFFMFGFVQEMQKNGKFSNQLLWLLFSGISAGLAIATKWTGLYAAAGLAVIFFTFLLKHCLKDGKKLSESAGYLTRLCIVCVISFIVIPLTLYALSYLEFTQSYSDKTLLQQITDNAKHMLSYHSSVTDTHAYESPWYSWIIDWKPLLDAFTMTGDETISSVATFGNPLIIISGFAAFVHNIYLWRVKKNTTAQFLSIAYISMLMPWTFIHRTVFIYQYFGCILIIVLLICNSLMQMKRRIKIREAALITASLLLFIMFFPEISGVSTDREYTSKVLEWLPSWIFE